MTARNRNIEIVRFHAAEYGWLLGIPATVVLDARAAGQCPEALAARRAAFRIGRSLGADIRELTRAFHCQRDGAPRTQLRSHIWKLRRVVTERGVAA